MINPIVTLVFGIIGGAAVSYFLAGTRWAKKLQATKQALLNQYDSDLAVAQQHNWIIVNREKQWLQEKKQLERQLGQVTRGLRTLEKIYDASAKEAHRQIAKLSAQLTQQVEQAEREHVQLEDKFLLERKNAEIKAQADIKKSRQNVDSCLEESQKVEQENRRLSEENKRVLERNNSLIAQKEKLEEQAAQAEKTAKEKIKQARKHAGVDFEDIIKVLFPSIVLQKDSASEIDNNVKKCSAILRALQAIENKEHRFEKVKGANKSSWFKTTKSFQLQSLRIYYCADRPSKGQYAVLVSEKKNQEKDIRWMKSQH